MLDALKEYVLYNWGLILVLLAFVIMLIITVFLDRRTVIRMFILIGAVFVLSIVVFLEFYFAENNILPTFRSVLIAIRYSATPIILSLILITLVKKAKWYVLIPAFILAAVNVISIFTGIVFKIDENGELIRGVLGYLPYVGVGVYSFFLVFILIRQSNKDITDIIPVVFLAFAFSTGLIFPFIIGKEYSKIFTTTIAIALFVYYVFLILQLTKRDALTGLLNRQAYYSAINDRAKDITGVVSIDMNGLKTINDTLGHLAGDEAITTLAACFNKSVKFRQKVYRIGGDEFIILCFKNKEEDITKLVSSINTNVTETKYTCSIGYYFDASVDKNVENMIKISDERMYKNKNEYYLKNGIERRK